MKNKFQAFVIQQHVPAGEEVWNGFIGGKTTCTAPKEPGFYTLIEYAVNNQHVEFDWVKE